MKINKESEFEFKKVLLTIKQALKSKSINYKELAFMIGMSESGVKKIFTSNDCSFSKLYTICDAIGLNLADIINESKKEFIIESKFTHEVENFFSSNLDYFYYFWKIIAERLPPEEVKKSLNLDETQNFRYLKKLDDFNLIELHENNRIKIPKMKINRWVGSGPLTHKIHKEWGIKLVQDLTTVDNIKNNLKNSGQHYSIKMMKLTPESHGELITSLKNIEFEFLARSKREATINPEKAQLYRFISGCHNGSFID